MQKIISMKQLRENFAPIRKGLKRGEKYLLMYRSRPLAELVPFVEEVDEELGEASGLAQEAEGALEAKNAQELKKASNIDFLKTEGKQHVFQASINQQDANRNNSKISRMNFANALAKSKEQTKFKPVVSKPKTQLSKLKRVLAPIH